MEGGLVRGRERISDRWRHSIKGGIGLVGRRVRIRVEKWSVVAFLLGL
jgi:hypothetical protein